MIVLYYKYMMTNELLTQISAWINSDVSKSDSLALSALLEQAQNGDQQAMSVLQDSFSGDLQFGTAGLRGEMAPGPNRMSLSVVSRAAYGIGQYLLAQYAELGLNGIPKVVIGYDARYHSAEFAERSAEILTALGCDVSLFDSALPTPVLAFALRNGANVTYTESTQKAANFDCGIMVTASHNPGKDNGYKVYLGGQIVTDNEQYWGQGAQIIAPMDSDIAALIKDAPPANEIPRFESGWGTITDDILKDYYAAGIKNAGSGTNDITVVTTAMHGVGGKVQIEMLKRLGITNIHPVLQQEEPNPAFPTVSFPNPEEKGALDLALALCNDVKADLLLANDPDADRLAVGCYDHYLGSYRALTGDEVGIILAHHFAHSGLFEDTADTFDVNFLEPLGGESDGIGAENPQSRSITENQRVVASSIASSRLVEAICSKYNIKYVTTLTGHKWISRVPNLVYGYEEALGHNVNPQAVRDKDGPMAGALIAAIACKLKIMDLNLIDLLNIIAMNFGLYSQKQLAIRLPHRNDLEKLVELLRDNPPSIIAGSEVIKTVDYLNNSPSPDLVQNAIELQLADKTRILVRPSGTEPKVKFYLENYQNVDQSQLFDDELTYAEELNKIRSVIGQKRAENESRLQEIADNLEKLKEQL